MSEERKEILRMLADKTISVDEAERLIKALGEGGAAGEAQAAGGQPKRRGFAFSLDSLGQTLAGLGPMVKGVVEDAIGGLKLDLDVNFGDEDEEMEPVMLTENRFPLEAGSSLTLAIRPQHKGLINRGGDLRIEGVEGDQCEVSSDHPDQVRIFKGKTQIKIVWGGGDLSVKVPQYLARLKAASLGGDVTVTNLPCEMKVKTMGGDLHLDGALHDFSSKTNGGDVHVVLAAGWSGEGAASTMGGDVEIQIPDGVNCALKAATLGGEIEFDETLGQVKEKVRHGRAKLEASLGAGGDESSISLKTMGGDIRIKRLSA